MDKKIVDIILLFFMIFLPISMVLYYLIIAYVEDKIEEYFVYYIGCDYNVSKLIVNKIIFFSTWSKLIKMFPDKFEIKDKNDRYKLKICNKKEIIVDSLNSIALLDILF